MTEAQLKKLKDDRLYRVTLNARAQLDGRTLYPGREADYQLSGAAIKRIAEAVDDAKPV